MSNEIDKLTEEVINKIDIALEAEEYPDAEFLKELRGLLVKIANAINE